MPRSNSLILNSPYTPPNHYWEFVEEGLPLKPVEGEHPTDNTLTEPPTNPYSGQNSESVGQNSSLRCREGRRPAGYMVADPLAKPYQDKGTFVPLPLVNKIRKRVARWREGGYAGVTGITKILLEHWQDRDPKEEHPFFFCQIEAIETLIWITEAPAAEKLGIDIPDDGGTADGKVFNRLCCKLATGTGKTVVMAMLIAWQAINRATYPKDGRFAKDVLIVAPNLTVRERLAVLQPSHDSNYYKEFNVVPISLREKLFQAKVLIRNWHALNWENEEQIKKKKSVDKRGAKSDQAYTREVLGELATARNFIVINDEAHHAWRVPAVSKIAGVTKEQITEATKWVGGLDRLHKTRGILYCFDFSATPFAPSGHKTSEESLFGWIVSDFGLNDAIEAGLVKTPRIVVRDDALPDAKTYKPKLYHLYNNDEVKDDLNRKAEPNEPLPDLITSAYALLGSDWQKTKEEWGKDDAQTPPVMISIANRTETAARIKYAFDNRDIAIDELCEKQGILHIDSKVLKEAEAKEPEMATDTGDSGTHEVENARPTLTRKTASASLREKVNTVGQFGKSGAPVQNVISVGMLSEGWDARTVTHIMGLRAFTSQLLCEQVVGRGLRRASYDINDDGLFEPEYVNVFGVPFSFLPHEADGKLPPPPPPVGIVVQPLADKKDFAVQWPNVIRLEQTYTPRLSVDWQKIGMLKLDTKNTAEIAEIAPIVDGKPDISKISDITLEQLTKKYRQQTMAFKTAQGLWKEMKPNWKGEPVQLMAELVRLAMQFIESDRIEITPPLFYQDKKRRRLVIALNMTKVMRHFWQAIKFSNIEKTEIVVDSNYPIRKTGDMRAWRTRKPVAWAQKSHINYCVLDSTWESSVAVELDRNRAVEAWVKNDHLDFYVGYVENGVVRKYYPDFLIRLQSGQLMVLEVKGVKTAVSEVKHTYMEEWASAVTAHGGFGQWQFAVSHNPSDVKDLLLKSVAE